MRKYLILAVFLILILSGCVQNQNILSLEDAKTKIVNFINNNLMQPGNQVSVKEITEEDGLYKVVVNTTQGQEITSYMTKDGSKFFPQVMDIAEIEKQAAERASQDQGTGTQTKTVADVTKAEKARAELFVMSFCPYGVIAETAMAPVIDLLGEKADIDVRFIASMPEGEDDINNVRSLHGPIEGIEDARQLCIAKNYDQDILWEYIGIINEKCYPIYRQGGDVYEECWTDAARGAGININTINSCVDGEGVELIKKEDKIAKQYGVTGSPTLIINGDKISAARNPEGYKTAICNGFTNPPEECEKVLSSEGSSASGGCE
jgi:hypothetical protein